MAGRPSKLTPQLTQRLCNWLQAGNFVETACDMEGISRNAFYEWMRRGERGWASDLDPVNYVEFNDTVKKAMATVETLTIADLRSGPMNWQAKAWWLERRHPDRWGNRSRNTNLSLNVDLSSLPDDIIERLAAGEDVDLATIASQSRARKTTPETT